MNWDKRLEAIAWGMAACIIGAWLLSACDDAVVTVEACNPVPCAIVNGEVVTGDAVHVQIGACRLGITSCVDGSCVGAVTPQPEVCDWIDNDCDGTPDNHLFRYSTDADNTCPEVGICRSAYQTCSNGQTVCNYQVGPREETCNGLDDDCDGEADDGLDQVRYDYPYDAFPNTVGVGACRPSVSRCANGQDIFVPAVTPGDEICANGQDDDCDGAIDEPGDEQDPRAIVLVVDVSGSMDVHLYTLSRAVCDWAQAYTATDTRFAVLTVSAGLSPLPYVALRQDFADAAATCATLTDPTINDASGGYELMYEGVMIGAELDWPEGYTRHQVAFTDEPIQLHLATESAVVESCNAEGFTLDAFAVNANEWVSVTRSCGGDAQRLDQDEADLVDALRSRFMGSC